MATRKVFIDESGIEIIASLKEQKLVLTLSLPDNAVKKDYEIVLSAEDTIEFIMDLYRLKKQIVK